MKTCEKCKKEYADNLMYCPTCGTALRTKPPAPPICSNCGRNIEGTDGRFCPYCGFPLKKQADGEHTPGGMPQGTAAARSNFDTNTENSGFLNSVKNDFQRSESIQALKAGAKQAAGKTGQAVEKVTKQTNLSKKSIGIIAAVLVVVVLALAVAFNTHRCDECDKVYVGRQYALWGSNICQDCYDYFTIWE